MYQKLDAINENIIKLGEGESEEVEEKPKLPKLPKREPEKIEFEPSKKVSKIQPRPQLKMKPKYRDEDSDDSDDSDDTEDSDEDSEMDDD